jgi:membrane protein
LKTLRRIGRILFQSVVNFDRDHGFDHAAVISYFALLSILPLSILLLAWGAAVIGSVDMAEKGVRFVLRDLVRLLGPDVFAQAREVGSQAGRLGWPFLLISLWTASKVFSKVEGALDYVFQVVQRRSYPVRKIFSFGLVALLALVILVLFVFSGVMTALDSFLSTTPLASVTSNVTSNPLYDAVDSVTSRYVLPWLMTVFTFGFVYKVVPAVPVPWFAAAIAGLMAGSLWEILKNAFTVYVGHYANYGRTYGALEAVVVFIIWVNLSAVLLLWGGELAAILSGARTVDNSGGSGEAESGRC